MMPNALIKSGLIPAIEELARSINSGKATQRWIQNQCYGSLGKSLDISVYPHSSGNTQQHDTVAKPVA